MGIANTIGIWQTLAGSSQYCKEATMKSYSIKANRAAADVVKNNVDSGLALIP